MIDARPAIAWDAAIEHVRFEIESGQVDKTPSVVASGKRAMRKRQVGIVTGDKMNKSRRVEVQRVFRHAKYGKTVRRRIVCHVHDENNESHAGDTVEIIESRPLSKLKRWALVKVVQKAVQGLESRADTAEKV